MTDTAGNGAADCARIKCNAYAYRDDIRLDDIRSSLDELDGAGVIQLYTVDGAQYYHVAGFENSQRFRWSKHLVPLPDGTPPDVADRIARQLQKKKASASDSEIEGEEEVEAEEEVEREAKTKTAKAAMRTAQARFCPPTADEVSTYCAAEGIDVNAARFVDYYASKGWKVGNQPMVDWKAAVRRWASSEDKTVSHAKAEWGFEDFVN